VLASELVPTLTQDPSTSARGLRPRQSGTRHLLLLAQAARDRPARWLAERTCREHSPQQWSHCCSPREHKCRRRVSRCQSRSESTPSGLVEQVANLRTARTRMIGIDREHDRVRVPLWPGAGRPERRERDDAARTGGGVKPIAPTEARGRSRSGGSARRQRARVSRLVRLLSGRALVGTPGPSAYDGRVRRTSIMVSYDATTNPRPLRMRDQAVAIPAHSPERSCPRRTLQV
jgi:hypothetical protein